VAIPINYKAILIFAIPIIIVIILSGLFYRNNLRSLQFTQEVSDAIEATTAIRSIRSDMKVLDAEQGSFLKTGGKSDLGSYDLTLSQVGKDFNYVQKLTASNTIQQQKLDFLKVLVKDLTAEFKKTNDERRLQGYAAAQAIVQTDVEKDLMDNFQKVIIQMLEEETVILKKRNSAQQEAFMKLKELSVFGILLTLLFSIVTSFSIIQVVMNMAQIKQGNIMLENARKEALKTAQDANEAKEKALEAVREQEKIGLSLDIRNKEMEESRIAVLNIMEDVKEAKLKALEAEERFRMIVEEVKDYGIFLLDVNGIVMTWNIGAERFKGYKAHEIIGQHFSRFFTKEDIASGRPEQELEIAKIKGIYEEEGMRIRKDGTEYWARVLITALKDKLGNLRGFAKITRDITEEKHNALIQEIQFKMAQIISEAENFDSAIPKIIEGICMKLGWVLGNIWEIDPKENVLRKGAGWARPGSNFTEFQAISQGMTFASGIGLPGRAWLHNKTLWILDVTKDANFPRIEHARKAGLHTALAFPIKADKQIRGVIEFYSHHIENPYERLLDVFDIIGAELGQFIIHKELELQKIEAVQTKSDFTSMVSHELRTPLTVIKESVGIVYDETAGPINADQKDFLDTAKRNVDRLGRLINDVMDYQKLESKFEEFRMMDQFINEVIKEVGDGFKMVLKNKGIGMRLDLQADLPKISFDKDKMIQVLTNLISNAMKFTSRGMITLSSEMQGQNAIKVSVKDQGIGIKPEDLDKLFKSFSQISTGTERQTGGTGLGLVLCKKIIEQHNGKVGVDSIFGQGSTFYFILPIKDRRSIVP